MGDYIRDYYRGYEGGCEKFKTWIVWDVGLRVKSQGFAVQGSSAGFLDAVDLHHWKLYFLGSRLKGLEFKRKGLEFRLKGSGFKLKGFGFRLTLQCRPPLKGLWSV